MTRKTLPLLTIVLILMIASLSISCSSGGSPSSSGESQNTAAYNTVHEELQNAVTAYSTNLSHAGEYPYNTATTFSNANCAKCYIINMKLLTVPGQGMLREVPAGCAIVAGGTTANPNDNCDGGATGCLATNHYVWGADAGGSVWSKCIGPDCNSNNSGYQGVWP